METINGSLQSAESAIVKKKQKFSSKKNNRAKMPIEKVKKIKKIDNPFEKVKNIDSLLSMQPPKGFEFIFSEISNARLSLKNRIREVDRKLSKKRGKSDDPESSEIKHLQNEESKKLLSFDGAVLNLLKNCSCEDDFANLNVKLSREVYRLNLGLPAYMCRNQIENAVKSNQFVVIQGDTGSGKSTQIPQYLAETLRCSQRIICTQPRKVSAISLAERVSEEWNCGDKLCVGREVGYTVGSARKTTSNTIIEYITEGCLLARLLEMFAPENDNFDPLFGVSTVIVDEAHERSITCDLILGILKMNAREKWPNLKVLVTSATIDTECFSKYLFNAPILSIPGRVYPVDVIYNPVDESGSFSENYVEETIKQALEVHRNNLVDSGDILCFLTGQDEVEKAKEDFIRLASKEEVDGFLCLAIHGKQIPEEQRLIFAKRPANTRKVIFATDVAETGITIDGVRYVIDSGMCKVSTYDPRRNITVLELVSISKSSAEQRKGRAGRTSAGVCYRLYSNDCYECMASSKSPQVLSKPLQLTSINLFSMGIDPVSFEWIDSPNPVGLLKSIEELQFLGALISCPTKPSKYSLTELGELVCALQIDPGMSRMLYSAVQNGFGVAACTIAAVMSVATLFYWKGSSNQEKSESYDRHRQFCSPSGDIVAMYDAYVGYERVILGLDKLADIFNVTSALDPAGVNSEVTVGVLTNNVSSLTVNETKDEKEGKVKLNPSAKEFVPMQQPVSTLSNVVKPYAQKSAKQYCKHHYLNNKSMAAALSTKADIMRVMRTFKQGKFWNAIKQVIIPSHEEIQKLVLKGSLLNIAIQTNASNEYAVISNNSPIVGVVHPSSSLTLLSNHSADGLNIFPKFLAYYTVYCTTRTFLHIVTPISEEWIKQDSLEFYENIVVPRMSSSKCCKRNFPRIRQDTLRAIVGRFYQQKNDVETELDCCIQYDEINHVLEVWCSPDRSDIVKNSIEMKINTARQASLDEISEEVISGNTRAVIGAGYTVKSVLFKGEYITISVSGLPEDCDEMFLRKLVSPYGKCVNLYLNKSAAVRGKNKKREIFGVVTFQTPVEAKSAYDSLHNSALESYTLSISADLYMNNFIVLSVRGLPPDANTEYLRSLGVSYGALLKCDIEKDGDGLVGKLVYKRRESAHNASDKLHGKVIKRGVLQVTTRGAKATNQRQYRKSQVIMSWALAKSECRGCIEFYSPSSANALLRQCDRGLNCPVLQRLGDRVRLTASIPEQWGKRLYYFDDTMASPYRINISGLFDHVDEVEIENSLKELFVVKPSLGALMEFMPKVCYVMRENINKDVKEESMTLLTAEFTSLVPMRDKVLSVTPFIDSSYRNRGGLYIQYDNSDDVEEALKIWQRNIIKWKATNRLNALGSAVWLYLDQPIRLEGKFSSSVSVSIGFWSIFGPALETFVRQTSKKLNVSSKILKPVQLSDEKGNRDCYVISYSAATMTTLSNMFEDIQRFMKFSVFSPRNDRERQLLFSDYGTDGVLDMLEESGLDSKCYVEFDTFVGALKVYGPDDIAARALSEIAAELTRLGNLLQEVKFQIIAFKRREVAIKWKALSSDIKAKVVSFVQQGASVTVVADLIGINSVQAWLKENLYLTSDSPRKPNLANKDICFICNCELENPYYYRACGHGGCSSCLATQFAQAERKIEVTLPVTCFSMECNKCLLAWADINSLAPYEAKSAFKDAALRKFVRENADLVRYCPVPGCNQILKVASIKQSVSKEDEIENGGVSVFCEKCDQHFCLFCSERDHRPVRQHKGDTCADTLLGDTEDIRMFVMHITENILTLRCPHCRNAILDFSGCCAVTCSCGGNFCGVCLTGSSNSSLNHEHVLRCVLNPNKGQYYASTTDISIIHRASRVKSLRQYFAQVVPKGDIKRRVYRQCEDMLYDLGIERQEIL